MKPEYCNNPQNRNNCNYNYNPAMGYLPTPDTQKTCCCKKSMKEALKLLCDTNLSNYIDYDKFAFLSPTFLVGSKLILLELGDEAKDNLAELRGSFERFTVGNCDTIDISGIAVYNTPVPFSLLEVRERFIELLENICEILRNTEGAGTILAILEELLSLLKLEEFSEALLKAILDFLINWFTVLPEVTQASLCEIQAIAFEIKDTGDFEFVKSILQKNLENTENNCGQCQGHCKCDDCCCNDGIKFGLLSANASHTVTLTAGNLILRDVTVLGNIGNVLVFANEEEGRFYFVCADTVQFLG